ncbi:ZYRO0G20130p [Zygosaccharomyces rouxii]|uniref:Mitochondrial intermediate peptidase n=1 Tax=Zygosaccharomyces rouxii (strain ATCC 2623 / CBS 732 / NBRC 1130 / NCYC 568 / NRRL Y-229) TaxID=559307 RepID=C5E1D6_ZYGRC|nr:uncharacterized protein ZYRO0G20130g [Zygosaccharomyces rouxii]KAH9202912.1 hypothetical protein LQ764DRAFT_54946 [Zygosaccharomyces rouxii]CAR29920.1 ZYRO0G20130p [Zygosaccharomyces rouxii]
MFKTGILKRNLVANSKRVRLVTTRHLATQVNKLSNSNGQVESLRRTFDDADYWNEANKQNYALASLKGKFLSNIGNIGSSGTQHLETGLFRNPYLTSPDGLRKFSRQSLNQAYELLEDMKNDETPQGLQNYILRLDQLSDTLCRVIDLCEFIRSSHPDSHFVDAAQDCHEEMFEFMNVLNTDVNLCNKLRTVLNTPEVVCKLSSEEVKVGKILLEDFEKSGIYMNPEIREQFIALSQEISIVGQDFINNTDFVRTNYITVDCETIHNSGINQLILSQLSKDIKGKHYKIPTHGYIAYSVLRACPDEIVRKKLWTAMHSCPDKQIVRLDQLVRLRAVLAFLMGKKSYAEYQLEGKMAKSPEEVTDFIDSLIKVTQPKAKQELGFISDLKRKHMDLPPSETSNLDTLDIVRPWDRDFYHTIYSIQQRRQSPIDDQQISMYFTLGNVMQGLSDLFHQIYGIRLEPVIAQKGETWSPEVRRLNVVSDEEGVIGVVYCDLFERDGKTSNPSHFTVCCSRQIYPKENDLSTIQIGTNKDGTKFQLPIISLVCNFASSVVSFGQSLCLLHISEIETLFHEMGHAMHSMLGRTRLQNLSGTRCATDFVELPSILMEHFARDTRVLRQIGKHCNTGEPVPESLLTNYLQDLQYMQYCETFSQAKMAMLDQRLHGKEIITGMDTLDVVALYQNLERELRVLVDDQSTWCGRFGHLFGYGATYYSYLFDRAIASKVWESLFQEDPFSRAGGQRFKEYVLKWGGAKDPWQCIADVLDQPELSQGGTDAMQFIGRSEEL